LSTSLGVTERDISGMGDVLLHQVPLMERLMEVRDGLDLVTAGCQLGKMKQQNDATTKYGTALKSALEGQCRKQDFVFISCPPASSLLVVNALFCIREVMVPITGDCLSLQGLSYLVGTFHNFETQLEHKIKQWFVLTRYHKRRRMLHEVFDKLMEYFPDRVFETRIREVAAMAECLRFKKIIFEYRKNSNDAEDYQSLALDLTLERTV